MEWEVELNKNFKFLAKQNTWASQRYRRVYMYNTNIKTKVLSESVWKKDEMGNSKRTNDQTNMKKGNLISNEKKNAIHQASWDSPNSELPKLN